MSGPAPTWPAAAVASIDQAKAMVDEHGWCSEYAEAVDWYGWFLADVVGGDLLDEIENETARRLFVSGWEVVRLPAWGKASPQRQYARLVLAWNDARDDGHWDVDDPEDAARALKWMIVTVVALWIGERTAERLA